MTFKTLVRLNFYRDSVALMRLAADLEALPGIEQASAIMATEANLAMLAATGAAPETITTAPNDLVVVVRGADEKSLAAAIELAATRLDGEAVTSPSGEGEALRRPRSLVEAAAVTPAATLALISCPGEYATAEAMKALRLGLDAMIFSDNVSLEDEVALKALAETEGRLVMGPDCGTAIINGVPLGFANIVRRGPVGIIAASGTGLQPRRRSEPADATSRTRSAGRRCCARSRCCPKTPRPRAWS
jgi:succinyl-CoA synthetase alpha subunit